MDDTSKAPKEKKAKDASEATPAMAQFLELKKEHPEYLLFYRMGDFYELFYEDAITASNAVGLTLTSRSKNTEKNIPMCGVPYHACDTYLSRLIKMGYKVAICEQMEDPKAAKKRGYKAVVRRDVVRLVTAGTITEDSILEAKRNNFILAVFLKKKEIGLAWLDISTSAFYTERVTIDKTSAETEIAAAIARLTPAEILIEDKMLETPELFSLFNEHREKLSIRPHTLFNQESANTTLCKAFKVQHMSVYGEFSPVELTAAGVLVAYVEDTQKGKLPRLQAPKRMNSGEIMEIDAATRRSLELTSSTADRNISLLKVIDKTITGNGGRLLAEYITAPIMNITKINNRLDAVSFFVDNPEVRRALRSVLRDIPDMERAIQRLSIGRGGPKDLHDLATGLSAIPSLREVIIFYKKYQKDSITADVPPALYKLATDFYDHARLVQDITKYLLEDRNALPALARAGNFVKEGACPPLDYLRNIRQENEKRCEDLKEKYEIQTGVSQLKIRNNSVIGYFVEVPARFADKLLDDKRFIHRQSVLNAVRFTTEELSKIEDEVNSSLEKAQEMEQEIFEKLVSYVFGQVNEITKSAARIAALDVAAALAELAAENNYVRPVVNDSHDLEIIEGRHPVVETFIKKSGKGSFVGNSCTLNADSDFLWLLTGPNMAGKSTFLRQNALIAIMAQAGSFVPATKATIGLINKIFSRVGASDDLARGRSTFMVEMEETAAILNRADNRSLVILDEIGRGTATFDGLSIAWAVVESLAEVNRCRTIFATHYHELVKLDKHLKGLSLHCMKVKEFNDEVVFLHEVTKGSADRSYGIHVAKLAGLPELTVSRAKQVLTLLEEEKRQKVLVAVEDELPLFENLRQPEAVQTEHPVVQELQALDVDSLTPREALDILYTLKDKIRDN